MPEQAAGLDHAAQPGQPHEQLLRVLFDHRDVHGHVDVAGVHHADVVVEGLRLTGRHRSAPGRVLERALLQRALALAVQTSQAPRLGRGIGSRPSGV
jgi:hypothetical protein